MSNTAALRQTPLHYGGSVGAGMVKRAGFTMNFIEGALNNLLARGRAIDGDEGSRLFIDYGAQRAFQEMSSLDSRGCECVK